MASTRSSSNLTTGTPILRKSAARRRRNSTPPRRWARISSWVPTRCCSMPQRPRCYGSDKKTRAGACHDLQGREGAVLRSLEGLDERRHDAFWRLEYLATGFLFALLAAAFVVALAFHTSGV